MSIEVKVPVLPESVSDATVLTWHKQAGDAVKRDEALVDLETDKVVLEIPAPGDGVLEAINQQDGAIVVANDILAIIKPGVVAQPVSKAEASPTASAQAAAAPTPAAAAADVSPAVRRLVQEHQLDLTQIQGSGKNGRITKEDVMKMIKGGTSAAVTPVVSLVTGERPEKRVPMSRMRAKIAERLLQAQHNAAMLTTFNEINLKAVVDVRAKYKEEFLKKHNVKLGFMSFFTKAVVEALKRFPIVNASIDGNEVIYHGYFDIGIAVSTERGLVVPIVRDADQLSLAEIEASIQDFAARARENKITLDDMQGGTFTITNGGVFGSLLATPIINPPQAGILGMHKIEQRPVVENGEIVIRPMMYIALSYDHRLIDGKDSVQFLATVKELLEDPNRILLAV